MIKSGAQLDVEIAKALAGHEGDRPMRRKSRQAAG